MAIFALDLGMFPFQGISGFVVIKFFSRGLPVNQLKALSVVLGVTTGTIFVGVAPLYDRRVKSLVGIQALTDFGMTFKTFETASRSCEPVARGALCHP